MVHKIMKTLILTRVADNAMSGNLYMDNKGRYYSDLYVEPEDGKEGTVYRLSPSKDIDGEPDVPVTAVIVLTNPLSEREKRERAFSHDYMMLDRMRTDCEYYNSAEHYNNAHGSTIAETIADMKERWQKLPEDLKPEWLSWEKILEYEKKFGVA